MSSRRSSLLAAIRRLLGLDSGQDEAIAGSADPPPPAFDGYALGLELFVRLHRSGLNLGIAEVMALRDAVSGGWGAGGPDDLAAVARLLWCSSRQEQAEFDLQWQSLSAYLAGHDQPAPPPPVIDLPEHKTPPRAEEPPPAPVQPGSPPPAERHPELAPLPVRAPFVPAPVSGEDAIQTYWPLARREMIYAWRYLRRPVADGARDVLDVAATVERSARQGFYLAPVYHRRLRNHAHLLLLVDQGGSMAPVQRFTRMLVETAQAEGDLHAVEVYYFYNIFTDTLYQDPHRTLPVALDTALAACDGETSVLFVSDAGAARGRRDRDRIRLTTRAVGEIKRRTGLVAWLNPMPRARWSDSSAQVIAGLAPMFPMNADGLSNAIDHLRGQG